MRRLRLPLLARLVATLAVAGLLPVAISFFQLKTNEDALREQVERTQLIATATAAKRVDAYLRSLRTLAGALAGHPAIVGEPQSAAAQELLRGTLQTWPDVVAAGVFAPAGEQVVLAQRRDVRAEIAGVGAAGDPSTVAVFADESGSWLRLEEPLPEGRGRLVLVAGTAPLAEVLPAREIGEQAEVVLVSRDGEVVAGPATALADFPAAALALAQSGKVDVGVSRFADAGGEDVLVGHAGVAGAPWAVLSRQPARLAEVAAVRIRRATLWSAAGALLLTALFSAGAWATVIRPLRRLVQAQSELAGTAPAAGSEIAQLEASFARLQERLRDSTELDKVFLGRYRVTELLGSGAMGSVFRGWDPRLKRPVALKTIRVTAQEVDRDRLVKSLLDEATISARFNHPHIVTVYDVAHEGAAAFIAMEYVDGVSLDSYLWQREVLGADEVVPLGAAIAEGLAAAHRHGLVHHDVKPANVLLGFDGSIKVTDFGISELISAATRSREVICGTPGYIAPECFLGEGYTPRSDLFSLGLILYEALVGRHPFFGSTLKQTMLNTLSLEIEPLDQTVPGTPPDLAELVARLLAKDPARRPRDASEVAAELAAMAQARNLVWAPDLLALRELKPARTNHSETRLVTLTEATPGVARP